MVVGYSTAGQPAVFLLTLEENNVKYDSKFISENDSEPDVIDTVVDDHDPDLTFQQMMDAMWIDTGGEG